MDALRTTRNLFSESKDLVNQAEAPEKKVVVSVIINDVVWSDTDPCAG